MATKDMATAALAAAVRTALTPPPAGVVMWANAPAGTGGVVDGWPTQQQLQDAVMAKQVAVNVWAPGLDRVPTGRYIKLWRVSAASAPKITVAPADQAMAATPGGTATVTIGGVIQVNDAVAVVMAKGEGFGQQAGAVYVVQAADTLATVAAGLAAALNADPTAGAWVTATSLGAVVTLAAKLGQALDVAARKGGVGQFARGIGRQESTAYVHIWANNVAARDAAAKAVNDYLRALPYAPPCGIALSDNTQMLVDVAGETWAPEPTMENALHWAIAVRLDWPYVIVKPAYDVLRTATALTTETLIG